MTPLIEAIKNFTILDINLDFMFWFWLLILIQLVIVIWAHKVTKRKLFNEKIYTPFAFLFVYSFTIFIVWWLVIIDLVKMKKQKW